MGQGYSEELTSTANSTKGVKANPTPTTHTTPIRRVRSIPLVKSIRAD